MRLAFFGQGSAFDFCQIGGTESVVRRLALGLAGWGAQTDYVMFGAGTPGEELVAGGRIRLRRFETYAAAVCQLLKGYEHVVTVYLPPPARLQFMRFRALHRYRPTFHHIYFSYPDSAIKRHLMLLDCVAVPYSGAAFAISPRQVRLLQRMRRAATLMLPPVPTTYFADRRETPLASERRVTYIGRLDKGKGIREVIELFTRLADHSDVRTTIHGYYRGRSGESTELNEWLSQQNRLSYFARPHCGFTPGVERDVRETLQEADILVLPYRRLSTTIDTPMLLLEAMAAQTAVITMRHGDIPQLYGDSICLLQGAHPVARARELILSAKNWLPDERARIHRQTKTLDFDVSSVVGRFAHALGIC